VAFRDFITKLLATQSVGAPSRQVPRWLVATAVRIGDALGRMTGGALHGPMSWQEYAVLGVEVTLNVDKARRELGYSPVMSREQGLAELTGNLAASPAGWGCSPASSESPADLPGERRPDTCPL